jgi:hypothetical protein
MSLGDKSYLQYCPQCGQKSFFYNQSEHIYECLNPNCKFVENSPGETKKNDYIDEAGKYNTNKNRKSPMPKWLSVLLIIFALSFIGLVINTLVESNFSNNVTTAPLTDTTLATEVGHTIVVTSTSQTNAKSINAKTGVYNNCYLGVVNSSQGVEAGDGCYDDTGNFIVLINNKNATDPSYSQLLDFLRSDNTDQYPYILTNRSLNSYYGTAESHVDLKNIQNIIDGTAVPGNPDVCADFAERLHNDAEMAGIRCAYVSLDLSVGGHACNAFQTTDRGLIYVDDTGTYQDPHPLRSVKTIDQITVGQSYIPVALFSEFGWSKVYDSVGTVNSYEVFWDGRWNN